MTEFKIGQMYRSDGKPVTPPSYLADKQRMRVSTMMRDSEINGVCSTCNGKGVWTEARLRCPDCLGKGGSIKETLNSMTTQTESARGGEFGNDHALTNDAKIQDAVARDRAWREASAGSRPGFRYDSSPEGKARRQKTFDAMAAYDDERESAWKDVSSTFEQNVTTLSKPPTPEELGQIKRNDGRTTAQIAKDHQARMAEETRNYENFLANAYKQLR